MSNTRYNANEVVANARSYTRYDIGQCLNYCWNCTDAPRSANLYDAHASWRAATMKETTGTPPAGALVYWVGGKHGHIAVSLGGGNIRSTDRPKGQVGNTTIAWLSREWGIKYVGWSRDYAGHQIGGLEKAAPKPAAGPPTLKQGTVSAAVKKLQADLLRVFPSYATPIKAGGGPITTFGPATVKVVKEFQRRVSLPQNGIVDAKTWAALAKSGIKP